MDANEGKEVKEGKEETNKGTLKGKAVRELKGVGERGSKGEGRGKDRNKQTKQTRKKKAYERTYTKSRCCFCLIECFYCLGFLHFILFVFPVFFFFCRLPFFHRI